ncbi:hypothetical protein QGN29_10875 [Temperatibacter marinus]|uniref:Uncharacterized protein n=1 Tax=Temperatibacter marinus TaxID=1456591 RepID=A0AA52EFU6_9PROT|nr:hypothetical protein [Temperatibacter marinus]WND02050.1 hypothetical protein QGN29_10875 [Temperatibacter marinus]
MELTYTDILKVRAQSDIEDGLISIFLTNTVARTYEEVMACALAGIHDLHLRLDMVACDTVDLKISQEELQEQTLYKHGLATFIVFLDDHATVVWKPLVRPISV